MKRATVEDAPTIYGIINHPTVRPTIGPGKEEFDPTDLIADGKNILLFDDGGGR